MELNKIRHKLLPIEEMARPVASAYTRSAVNGKSDILYELSKEIPENGVVVWHDYYNKLDGCREAGRAIDEFLKKSEQFEVIMPETVEKLIRVARRKL